MITLNLNFQPQIKNPEAGMWLGATDFDSLNFFNWEQSKKKLRNGFRNWDLMGLKYPRIPNRRVLNCLMMWKDSGMWTNDYCNATTPEQVTMCEILNVKPGSGTAKTTAPPTTTPTRKPGQTESMNYKETVRPT